ncbi:MAG: protein kinase domain-containing protein [Pseudoalteromonas prydzensis]|uniref:protein kinase domain-containing protein n=1 Tax=Pseudoalteromonas prydzensis TaxID=182141 RepID=UPI003F9CA82D
MKFSDSLSLFEYLLKEHPNNLMEGLDGIKNISNDMLNETKQLILAHNKNLQQTQFHQSISHSTELLNENKKIESLIGKHISHFTLEALIGSGGMGVVYLARRNDGKFEQKVAIKIVYPTITVLHGPQNLTREAQYLAKLNHPNIAGVLDAGECEFGMYMVMEYIEGTTFLSYCQEQNLNTKQRLLLFCKVCDAVNYAHQNRVIHADLKPSNILINKQGEPKLVDFGVARTINSEQTDFVVNEYIKALSQEYASPEQLAGKTLTTQSDVYSLGKILSSILTKPNHELDLIMNKSTTSIATRYMSVHSLLIDISLFLADKPISLIENNFYFIKKAFKRNPVQIVLSLCLFFSIIGFSASIWNKNIILQQEMKTTENIANFMIDAFSRGNPEVNAGHSILAKDLLSKHLEEIDGKLSSSPNIQFNIKYAVANSLYGLGEYAQAINTYKSALQIHNKNSSQSNTIKLEITKAYIALRESDKALDLSEQVLLEKITDTNRTTALWLKGKALDQKGEFQQAKNILKNALVIANNPIMKADIMLDIAHNQLNLSMYKESIKSRQQALKIFQHNLPEHHQKIAYTQLELAAMLHNLTRHQEAIDIGQKGLATSIDIYGVNHPYVAKSMQNIAIMYNKLNKTSKARQMLLESIEIQKKLYPMPIQDNVIGYVHIGNLEYMNDNFKEAEEHYLHGLELAKNIAKLNPYITIGLQNGLANIYTKTKQFELATTKFDNLINLTQQHFGERHARVGLIIRNALPAYIALQKNELAKEKAELAIEILSANYGNEHTYVKKIQQMIETL